MLNKSKYKYLKYVQKGGVLTFYEKKYMTEKINYNMIFGDDNQEEFYWSSVKIRDLGEAGTNSELCKIISSFAGSERNGDIEFAKKDESSRRKLMMFFFGANAINMDYYICDNIEKNRNIVLFYNKQKLNYLIEAFNLHNYFDLSLKNTDIKKILLSLPCQWIQNRPEEDDIIIQMLFGNIEPCVSKDDDIIRRDIAITMESPRWETNEKTMKLKEIYKTYIRLVYSNMK